MSHSHYQSFLVPIQITTVKTCRCYEQYQRQLKRSTSSYVEFDYSIEKAFSYRKYFNQQGLLYHFCINCLFDIVSSIPMRIIEYEILRGHMGCIFKFRHRGMVLGESCSLCINYSIKHYSAMFFMTIQMKKALVFLASILVMIIQEFAEIVAYVLQKNAMNFLQKNSIQDLITR